MTTSSERGSVAVLGLGRMGAAMARRLADQGWTVTGWSRSGRALPAVPTTDDPVRAVQDADLVVLALFDGRACEQVLELCGSGLSSRVTVVNTSTVAPHEAAALEKTVHATGAAYVHGPVMGSVPAVRAGSLRVLVGGSESDVARALDLLSTLGEVRQAGDAASAAALKLVANGALGGALLALRGSRQHAADLAVDHGLALDVLERGPLGALVQGKRERFEPDAGEARPGSADFAVAALAKDLALLADASPGARHLSGQVDHALASGAVAPDDDIAAITAPAAYSSGGLEEAHGLSIAREVVGSDDVLAPLRSYVAGHATGDPEHFRRAFLPTAHVEGLRDGTFVSWSLPDYCALFGGRPAPDEASRRRRLEHVFVEGSVGTATMTLHHGADTFTDVFLLVRVDATWRIANKAYHRAS